MKCIIFYRSIFWAKYKYKPFSFSRTKRKNSRIFSKIKQLHSSVLQPNKSSWLPQSLSPVKPHACDYHTKYSPGHAVAPVPAARKANNRTVVLLRTSPENKPYAEEDGSTTVVNGTAKPVKKVEFCKTELHFAADSGKVNIVETDGKPPPTNKFRRRRRSHGLNAQQVRLNNERGQGSRRFGKVFLRGRCAIQCLRMKIYSWMNRK